MVVFQTRNIIVDNPDNGMLTSWKKNLIVKLCIQVQEIMTTVPCWRTFGNQIYLKEGYVVI